MYEVVVGTWPMPFRVSGLLADRASANDTGQYAANNRDTAMERFDAKPAAGTTPSSKSLDRTK